MEGGEMTKWEYLVRDLRDFGLDFEEQLNELGTQGWELITYSYGVCTLKRPLVEQERMTLEADIPTVE